MYGSIIRRSTGLHNDTYKEKSGRVELFSARTECRQREEETECIVLFIGALDTIDYC